jgi:putative membrane protein insertion efficiency factor
MSPRGMALGALRAYQRWISPLLPRACRFEPSCSEYAREAIETHGLPRGAWLATQRLLRCQPLSRGGYDPVPARSPSPRRRGVARP